MKPDTLVVFGSGGHAKVVVEAILARTPDRAVVVLDDSPTASKRRLLGVAVSGGRELLTGTLNAVPVALAIGENRSRAELMHWLISNGNPLEAVIHPTAVVGASVSVGAGAFVAAGAVIIADSQIGAGVIINTGATVDHDCEIYEAAHIAPGVNLCGNVRVGFRSLVGVGSSVRPGVRIADDIIVGAGSVVVSDLTEAGKFVGSPARRLR